MSALIVKLRTAYSAIDRVNPDDAAYKKLCVFLDKQDTATLIELANARIKWVSNLALNRIWKREEIR
jgi:hypothetical protein